MTAADATRTAHPEYTAGATAWLDDDGDVQARRGLIVQCPTVDHEHTRELHLVSKLVQDPEVGLAWVVTASDANGMKAMDAAMEAARALAVLLANPAFKAV